MFGTLRKAHFAALSVLCLVVATATAAQAQVAKKVDTSGLSVTTTFTTATFTVATNMATGVTVATGTAKNVLIATPDRPLRLRHRITVRGLTPNTSYVALVTITPKNGRPVKHWLPFQTAAPGTAPATVTTRGNKLLLNGQPWFAIMGHEDTLCPNPELVTGLIGLGASVLEEENPNVPPNCDFSSTSSSQWGADLHERLNNRLWYRVKTPGQVEALKAQSLPELIDWQASIKTITSPSPEAYENPCFAATQLFKATTVAAKTKPVVFQEDVATYGAYPGRATCKNPQNVNMALWAAIAAHGAGVTYYTADAGNGPDFDVTPELASQIRKVSNQAATLGPVFLGGKNLAIRTDTSSLVKFGAWLYGGAAYVVAVNTGNSAAIGTFALPVSGKTAQVLWENRSVKEVSGNISDNFALMAVHIYKIVPPKKK